MKFNGKERGSNPDGESLSVLRFLVAFLSHQYPLEIGKEGAWSPESAWKQWRGEVPGSVGNPNTAVHSVLGHCRRR
jgi:hypothetical protein